MLPTNFTQKFGAFSIKSRILFTCFTLLLIIIVSNGYTYLGNEKMIREQTLLTQSRLRKLLLFETISTNITLAELHARSFLFSGKVDYRLMREQIWKEKITPAIEELQTSRNDFKIASHQELIEALLKDITAFEALQQENEKRAHALFNTTSLQDTLPNVASKESQAVSLADSQQILFNQIKQAATRIAFDQRTLIKEESETLAAGMQAQQTMIILLVAFSILLAALLSYRLIKATIVPLQKLSTYLTDVSIGKLPEPMATPSNEVGVMMGAINQLVTHLKASAGFAVSVGEGNYNTDYRPASGEDTLGISLLSMQEKLSQIEKEDKKRNWATGGFARFSELLRTEEGNTEGLAEKLISSLVSYVEANQGGIFLINDTLSEDIHVELIACYAFNRKKFLQKRIDLGEGLVGQAIREEDTIYITDVPQDYIHITSGLGGARPRSILIVPLKVNEKVYGAIELASFHSFEPHQIAFIEKLSESIASTISSVKINEQTRHLLEVAQQQAEEMRAQEEEMRQNTEELEATQEEIKRKSAEMESQLTAIDFALATIEFNMDGTVIRANEKFLELMGYSLAEIGGKHHRLFVEAAYSQSGEYAAFWENLRAGHPQTGDFERITKDKQHLWLKASYTPAYDSHGNLSKVIKFAQDITGQRKLQLEVDHKSEQMSRIICEIEAQTNIVNSIAIVSKTDLQGNITYVNEEFLKWSKYAREEVMGKNHRFLKSGDQEDAIFEELWRTISSGKVFRGQIKNKAKDGTFYWVDAIIAPVLDEKGKPKEYIAQRFVINEVKEKEAQVAKIMEQMQLTQQEMKQLGSEMQAQTDIINSIAIVSKTDLQGNITYVNEEFLKWSKYSREEVIGKNHRILKSGDQPDAIFEELWRTISSGKTFRGEIKNKAKDGTFYWVDAIIAPIFDENGKPKEYIAQRFVIDAAKEKEAIVQAQTNIINSIAIVSKTDLQGNITYVNEEFLKWSKYSREEVMGKNHRFLKSGDQEDAIFEELWKTISSGKIFRGQIKNKAKDGTFYWVDAIIAPVLDEKGKPKEYIAQRFVINEVKEKETYLAQAMEQAKALELQIRQHMEQNQAGGGQAIIMTNAQGKIEWVNERFVEMTGYTLAEVAGKKPGALLQGEGTNPKDIEKISKAIENKVSFEGQILNYSKSGRLLVCQMRLSPVINAAGKVDKFISTATFVEAATEPVLSK